MAGLAALARDLNGGGGRVTGRPSGAFYAGSPEVRGADIPERPVPMETPFAAGAQGMALPAFREIREELVAGDRFVRLPAAEGPPADVAAWRERPVDIALDIGSSMAKLVIAAAGGGETLWRACLPNKGDALQTVRSLLADLAGAGADGLKVQHWGLTGSGRHQIRKILQAVYPHLQERIFTLVENEAHVLGSLVPLKDHIAALKRRGRGPVNGDFGLLVDIGGEDTKISVVSLGQGELFENAMNSKCSAGTGSLMDVLRDLLDIPDVGLAYRMAEGAPRAWRINAACAVFLLEEARKMQARGVDAAEILASCCHAIVENMARTLWRQVTIPPHPVVLLHGQTMLSDPLALAAVARLETHCRGPVYGLVPPHPGHRACHGLLSRAGTGDPPLAERCDWERFTGWSYDRKLIACPGVVCGNKLMRCTRTAITPRPPARPQTLVIGGCTSVNEQGARHKPEDAVVPDAYREIWQWIDGRHPRSESPERLVIPRCFSLSSQAYRFALCFQALGIPVHTDTVRAEDLRAGQGCFELDTCAPNIGAAGQCIRLAGEPHGLILLPQIDFLPTGGASLGRTCTTNQGGIWAAVQFARLAHPGARFLVTAANLGEEDESSLTRQLYRSFGEVFARYGLTVGLAGFREAWREAGMGQAALDEGKADLTAGYLEKALQEGGAVTVVCGREYVLTPGIYDQHISKLLRDKGILPVPSCAFDAPLDPRFAHIYWRTAHDVLTRVESIVRGRLHQSVVHPRLREAVRRLETEGEHSRLSHAVVTTFRCGPDSVTAPLLQEISRSTPFVWIQSDGTIAELAHLENRISTLLRRLRRRGPETHATGRLALEVLAQFDLVALNPATDVVYVPTLGDNRVLTAMLRGMGVTAVDNYADGTYDLERQGKAGRRIVGDDVCLPLASVLADMLAAVEDFLERKRRSDPLLAGKHRIVLFMNGGDGPCRFGQYIHLFKLAFLSVFGGTEVSLPTAEDGRAGEKGATTVRFLENLSSSLADKEKFTPLLEPWAAILGFQGVVAQGLCYSLLLKAASLCPDEASYQAMLADHRELRESLIHRIEKEAPPARAARRLVAAVSRRCPPLAAPAAYLGYGIWRNFGLREPFRAFAGRWIFPAGGEAREKRRRLRVHLDGEVYLRTCQAEEILRRLIGYLGFGAFEMTLSPIWCFFEALLFTRGLNARERIADLAGETDLPRAGEHAVGERGRQERALRDTERTTGQLRDLLARPLYAAAGIPLPHPMRDVYAAAAPIIPTGKPFGELVPFVGEAVLQCRAGADLILNVSPQGCMVSGMGEMLIPSILAQGGAAGRTTIVSLYSQDGEIDEERLRLALLRAAGEAWDGVLPAASP